MKSYALIILLTSIYFISNSQTVITLKEDSFKTKIWDYEKNNEFKFEGEKPIILDFSADWCKPCRMIKPHLDDLQKHYKNDLQIYTMDAERYDYIADKFNVKYLPTLIFITPKNDTFYKTIGYKDKRKLKSLIRKKLKVK